MGSEEARQQCLRGTADHRLHFAEFVNGKWQSEELARMGAGLLDTEEDYTGLGVIDTAHGKRVYISTPICPTSGDTLSHHEIFCGEKQGNGWIWQAVTKSSDADNLRPLLARLPANDHLLLWLHGSYRHQTDYATEVQAKRL